LFEDHPRTADNLEVIQRWENARTQNFFSEKQKDELKNLEQEHILLINEAGKFELIPYEQLKTVAKSDPQVRAFIFKRNEKNWVVYWHVSGTGKLKIKTDNSHFRLYKTLGTPIATDSGPEVLIPLEDVHYLEFDIPRNEVAQLLDNADVL
jgi:hypothetical protein